MATLHVRNVPDELYELLRERAAANDRSIAAEALQLLSERLALAGYGPPRRPGLPGRRRRSGSGPFTRFTADARDAVVAAQEEARVLGHGHVGTDHLLLGVLLGEGRPAARALADLGLTAELVRTEIERVGGRGDTPHSGPLPFTPGAKQALELALREALKLGHSAIGLEHVVLGILGQGTSSGTTILRSVEPDEARLRADILKPFGPAAQATPGAVRLERMPYYRVVQLEGDAEAWEAQLNAGCPPGYDLVEIVERRAILRRV